MAEGPVLRRAGALGAVLAAILTGLAWCSPARADLAQAADRCFAGPGDARCEPHTADGYVILKDQCGMTQRLLVAHDPITGIEDPALRAAKTDFLEAAWDAGRRFLPGRDLTLVVNSLHGRSAGRFHIHIDLARPGLLKQVSAAVARMPADGSAIVAGSVTSHQLVEGRYYDLWHVRSLARDEEGTLFNKLFAWLGDNPSAMEYQSLAVFGLPDGTFLVFNGHVVFENGAAVDNGNAEALEIDDHGTKVDPAGHCHPNDR